MRFESYMDKSKDIQLNFIFVFHKARKLLVWTIPVNTFTLYKIYRMKNDHWQVTKKSRRNFLCFVFIFISNILEMVTPSITKSNGKSILMRKYWSMLWTTKTRNSYRGFLQAVKKMVMIGIKNGVGLTYQRLARLFRCLIGDTEKSDRLSTNQSSKQLNKWENRRALTARPKFSQWSSIVRVTIGIFRSL